MTERFEDRSAAGRLLGEELAEYAGRSEVLVLGLPRGGVPVAYEVARRLGTPLDVFVVRKLGVPGHEELALGAVASGGARVLNHDVVAAAALSQPELEELTSRELDLLERQEREFRGGRGPQELEGTTAILVDDGLATGATMRVAIQALRARSAARIVAAVPVAPAQSCAALAAEADEMVCPRRPEPFTAVGLWYRDFSPVSDDTVRALLEAG